MLRFFVSLVYQIMEVWVLLLSILKLITAHTIWKWENTGFLYFQEGPLPSTGVPPFHAHFLEIKMKQLHYATVVKWERHQKPIFERKKCCYPADQRSRERGLSFYWGTRKEFVIPMLQTQDAIGRQISSLQRVNTDCMPITDYGKQIQNMDLQFEILNKCTQEFKVWINKIK